jgi:hypothetical protein
VVDSRRGEPAAHREVAVADGIVELGVEVVGTFAPPMPFPAAAPAEVGEEGQNHIVNVCSTDRVVAVAPAGVVVEASQVVVVAEEGHCLWLALVPPADHHFPLAAEGVVDHQLCVEIVSGQVSLTILGV